MLGYVLLKAVKKTKKQKLLRWTNLNFRNINHSWMLLISTAKQQT